VNLEGAVLTRGHFEGADLRGARLNDTDLSGANLDGANMALANLEGANLSGVYLEDTIFRNVKWGGKGRTDRDGSHFTNFDVRGIRYSDPLFDRFVRQSEFIRSVRERKPLIYWLWLITCYCGRSILLWAFWCVLVILGFGRIYAQAHKNDHSLLILKTDRQWTRVTPYYFSLVTFSTLGFGDVTPKRMLGEIVVMAEVFVGYVMLGGLISIFTMKLVPPL